MSGDGVPPGSAPAEAEAVGGTDVFADIFGGDSDSSSFGFGSGGGDDDLPGEPGVSSSAAAPGAAGSGLLGTLDAGEGASAIAEGADGDGSGDEGGEGGQRRRRRRKRRKKKKKKKKDKKKDKRKRKRSASQSGEDSIFGDPEDADAPRRKRKKKQTKPRKRRKSPEINPENMTDFDMAIQRLKKAKRKTRRSDDFIEDTGGDDMIRDLMVEMDEAAAADRRSNRAGEPALRKTLLLPKVRAVMENRAFAYKVVENGILKSVTGWMRPLPSGSFPSFTIRTTLMELLLPLPISTHDLKSSGLGKVIRLYVQKLKGDERKAARALVQKWIRPIVNSTADYRQLHQYDSDRVAMQNIPNELTVQRSPRNDGEEPEERLRAAIPWAEVTDFVRRPKSRIDKNLDRPKLSEQVPDLYKRINSRIRTMGAKNKKDRKQIATISVSKITPT